MKRKHSFFKKYFPFTLVAVATTVVTLGLLGLSLARTQNFAVRSHLAEITAHLLEGLNPDEFRVVLRQLENVQNKVPLLRMNTWVLDAQGTLLYSTQGSEYPYAWERTPKPGAPYEFTIFKEYSSLLSTVGVIRISGVPTRFIVIGGYYDTASPRFMISALASIALAVMAISILITMLFFFLYFRAKADEASHVLTALKSGNLKARFSVKMLDEIGHLMSHFNEMADEIERLVEDLRVAHASRANLLQELAHDVQTPLTSLRTLLEALQVHDKTMSAEKRQQCFYLASTEILYLERLIKDLLTLAVLGDPKFKIGNIEISLDQVIQRNLIAFHSQYENILVTQSCSVSSPRVRGDALLLDRLFKNALSNAFKFTRTQVAINLTQEGGDSIVSITDNGPGLSEEDIRGFGVKKLSRVLRKVSDDDQIGLGLGSVIMREIAAVHGGTINVKNIPTADGTGAMLQIRLPGVHTPSIV